MVKTNAGSLARRRSLYAPIHVRLFGSDAKMLAPNHLPNLIEQFRLVPGSLDRYTHSMSGIFASLTIGGKRIRKKP
jgi:hypothetical protein